MHTSVLVKEDMPRFRDQVTGGSFSQAALEAASSLMEQRPGMLLAYVRVERLQDLLQRYALSGVQVELPSCTLAHHSDLTCTSFHRKPVTLLPAWKRTTIAHLSHHRPQLKHCFVAETGRPAVLGICKQNISPRILSLSLSPFFP